MAIPLPTTSATAAPAAPAVQAQTSLRLHDALRVAGLRPTFHRLQVMRVVDGVAPKAVTAEAVYQILCEIDVAVSQATVYRALSDLEQHGLLARTRLQGALDNKVRYAVPVAAAQAPGYTFCCRVCHEHIVVTNPVFCDLLQRQAQDAGFDRQLVSIDIAITCNRCAE